jgi:hypothetical protein
MRSRMFMVSSSFHSGVQVQRRRNTGTARKGG